MTDEPVRSPSAISLGFGIWGAGAAPRQRAPLATRTALASQRAITVCDGTGSVFRVQLGRRHGNRE
jgi:hypothetical protein